MAKYKVTPGREDESYHGFVGKTLVKGRHFGAFKQSELAQLHSEGVEWVEVDEASDTETSAAVAVKKDAKA